MDDGKLLKPGKESDFLESKLDAREGKGKNKMWLKLLKQWMLETTLYELNKLKL